MNTLILLGTDGMKCLSCVVEEKETIGDKYKDCGSFAKEYKKCDILIRYNIEENNRCRYSFHSCKRGASCDKLIKALGGSSLNQRAGIISASRDLLKLDSNKYYVLKINDKISDMWEYLPLRDCSDFPSHLL